MEARLVAAPVAEARATVAVNVRFPCRLAGKRRHEASGWRTLHEWVKKRHEGKGRVPTVATKRAAFAAATVASETRLDSPPPAPAAMAPEGGSKQPVFTT